MHLVASLQAQNETDRNVWILNRCYYFVVLVAVLFCQLQVANATELNSDSPGGGRNLATSIDRFVGAYVDGHNFSGTILANSG